MFKPKSIAKTINTLVSVDGTKNYIIPYHKSFLEARYVQRHESYVSLYVSSHNGCKMACDFCWLTQQKQTNFKHTSIEKYSEQVKIVLDNIPELKKNTRININFMSRGESLANKHVIQEYPLLYDELNKVVKSYDCSIKMNLSTIMPHTIKNYNLIDIFDSYPVNIYYSLYSVNDKLKKNIMPNAINTLEALDKLVEFQNNTKSNENNNIVFHWAFIKGFNDNLEEVNKIIHEIKIRNFKKTKFNLVRFNPPPKSPYVESDNIHELFEIVKNIMQDENIKKKSTIISRVGFDVYGSCGMFVDEEQII